MQPLERTQGPVTLTILTGFRARRARGAAAARRDAALGPSDVGRPKPGGVRSRGRGIRVAERS
eukprot:7219049-Prymnesium_polylepis.1